MGVRVAGDEIGRFFFSASMLESVAARQDPKCPVGWHVKYAARVARDFDELHQFLKTWHFAEWRKLALRVTDIGCGFAGIDVLLTRWLHVGEVMLIDGDGSSPRAGGFHSLTIPWNDVRIAEQFVRENVIVDIHSATVPPAPPAWETDLIISLKSWGHHYEVDCYLAYARRCLRPGGLIILDIRKNTDGRHKLENYGFECLGRAGGTLKTDRLVFREKDL